MLENFAWPGNIRQLQNVLERAALTSEQELLEADKLRQALASESAITIPGNRQPAPAVAEEAADSEPPRQYGRAYNWVQEDEADRIRAMLSQTNNNQSEAARRLNISLRQLRYRVDKLGISRN